MGTRKKTKTDLGGRLSRLLDAFFLPAESAGARWFDAIGQGFLYLLGALHWGYFLNWSRIPFDLHDWVQAGAYFSFLRQAALSNQLPLQIGSALSTTERYLGRPDTLISPQAYLLRFLEPGPFMLANLLILFSIGFLGLLVIKRRYKLSLAAFTTLFALFNFNGNITAHLAVGHTVWTGYYFLPFFALLVLKAVEGEKTDWKWVLLVALTLFAMTLQGAFHFMLWCLFFLLAWGICTPKYFLPAVKAIGFTLLLSLFRLLPPAVEFISGGKDFVSGFPTVADLFAGMVTLKYPQEALASPFKSLGWWELDTYVGLLGLAFLIFFGVYRTWQKKGESRMLLAPIAVITFLSIGRIYAIVNRLPIPLADSERISSRFFIVPVVFLLLLGSICLQEYLARPLLRGLGARLLSAGGLVLLVHDLLQHSRIWRVTNMYTLFESTPADIRAQVLHYPDPPYFTALVVGAVISLLTLAILLFLGWRERRRG